MQIAHVTIGVGGRIEAFADAARRHAAVRSLVRGGGDKLAIFNVLPDHAHTGHVGEAEQTANWRRGATLSLRNAAAAEVQRSFETIVTEHNHARSLIGYVLSQCAHHDLPHDDALWTGSCFQDLVGARWLDGWKPAIRALDGRFRLRDALTAVGLPVAPIEPASTELVYELGPMRLRHAAVAALAAAPDLAGNGGPELTARVAIVRLAREAGTTFVDLGRVLDLDRRSVLRLARRPCPEPALLAVRTRLGLEEVVRAARAEQAWSARRAAVSHRREAALEG